MRHGIATVLELGCGDGNQLSLASYTAYLGLDVSATAIALCRARFAEDLTKRFALVEDEPCARAELALSLDVIFHLVEDEVFDGYMRRLFAAGERHVVIYSSDREATVSPPTAAHVRHRRFSDWVREHRKDFGLVSRIANDYPKSLADGGETSFCDFFHYRRGAPAAAA